MYGGVRFFVKLRSGKTVVKNGKSRAKHCTRAREKGRVETGCRVNQIPDPLMLRAQITVTKMETTSASQRTEMQVLDGLSPFEREYFIQTRKEIDTEKQERNRILNYGILVIGGIGVALSRVGELLAFLKSPTGLCLYIPFLVLVSMLIVARRAKLRQIGDRWFVLEAILKARKWPKNWVPLETVVCRGLRGMRYLYEDLWLHLGLSMGPYLLIIWVGTSLPLPSAMGLGLLVMAHAIIGSVLLCRPVNRADRARSCGWCRRAQIRWARKGRAPKRR